MENGLPLTPQLDSTLENEKCKKIKFHFICEEKYEY